MIRRFFYIFFILMIGLWGYLRWGNVPSGMRVIESLLRPVIYKEIINYYAGIYKEDPLFVTAIIKVESNFYWKARSHRGAIGLMQIMPPTGKEVAGELGIKNFEPKALEDPKLNIRFGFHYISKLRKEFGDNDTAVLASYNGGRKNVRDWLNEKKKKELNFEDIQFYETKKFTKDVLRTYNWLKRIQKWRNRILEFNNRNQFHSKTIK